MIGSVLRFLLAIPICLLGDVHDPFADGVLEERDGVQYE